VHDGGKGFDYIGRVVRPPVIPRSVAISKVDEGRACLSIMWRKLTKVAEH